MCKNITKISPNEEKSSKEGDPIQRKNQRKNKRKNQKRNHVPSVQLLLVRSHNKLS